MKGLTYHTREVVEAKGCKDVEDDKGPHDAEVALGRDNRGSATRTGGVDEATLTHRRSKLYEKLSRKTFVLLIVQNWHSVVELGSRRYPPAALNVKSNQSTRQLTLRETRCART